MISIIWYFKMNSLNLIWQVLVKMVVCIIYKLSGSFEKKTWYLTQNIFHSSRMMQMSLYFLIFLYLQKGRPSEFIRGRINSLKKQPSALPTHSLVNHHFTVEVIHKQSQTASAAARKLGSQAGLLTGTKKEENISEAARPASGLWCSAIVNSHNQTLVLLLYA